MKISLFSVVLGALALAPLNAQDPLGFDTTPYQYQREVIGSPTLDRLLSVTLDRELYGHSGPDHATLRLVKEGDGLIIELPRVIVPVRRAPAPIGETLIPQHVESFFEHADGSIEISFTLSGDKSPAYLEIATPLRDFEKNVIVSTSPDGLSWSPLVNEGLIFDYERFLDFRRTRLDLPPTTGRHFKVRLADATDRQRALVQTLSRTVSEATGVTVSESGTMQTRPFRIDAIRFFSAPPEPVVADHDESYILEIVSQQVDPEPKTTVILLDGGGLPLREFTFSTADRNFRRELLIQVPDQTSPDAWQTVHRGFLHRYDVGDFQDERLSLRFEERRSERYRLVIDNGDNPPLHFTGISGAGDREELLFLAEPDDHLSLFLGALPDTSHPSQLDTAAILAARKSGVPNTRLDLGPLTANPGFRPSTPADPRFLESKVLLWIIIALVVAMMTGVLYQTLKKVESVRSED